ncbi:hypothetical protein MMC15_000281 [Xylographa vitiligo]|nr:hypothetical protein [Xylographa vitiligo]
MDSRESRIGDEKGAVSPNVVDFEDPNDPANPMNWSRAFKWLHVALLAWMSFVMTLGEMFFAPSLSLVLDEFDTSAASPLSAFVISVYGLGSILGNAFAPQLSEVTGRLSVLHVSNAAFVVFAVAIGSFHLGTLGPVAGPVIGGFLAEDQGWRWIFWLIAILGATGLVLAVMLMREFYAPVLLSRKAKRLRQETGSEELRSKHEHEASSALTARNIAQALLRPAKMFLFMPMVTIISLYLALGYGYMWIIFTRLNLIYENVYDFSQGAVGLTYLGVGVGTVLGILLVGTLSDWYVVYAAGEGEKKPEYRLPPMVLGAVFVPAGLLLYGWAAQYKLKWVVPLIGTGMMGFGLMMALLTAQTYLIDSLPLHAASANAVVETMLALSGSVFPLAGPALYDHLGLGWGNSLLCFIALPFVPLPWILLRYGERIRKSSRSQLNL